MERVITYNLKENFIRNLADFIEENFLRQGKDISKLAFVFSGRRPALFLKRELSKKIKKSFFSPRFFSIDEFVEYALYKQGPFLKIPDLDACFIIYKLAQERAPDILRGRLSFSEFLSWGREALSFIEQLDLEDIQIESLKNIQEKAAIGYDVPENINTLLSNIISLRDAYQSALKKKNLYSRGLMYLLASRYIGDIDLGEFEWIIFCGFFYPHKTEQVIMENIHQRQKALFFFQEDKEERSPDYNLCIQAGFDAHSQACLVRQILKKIPELDKTVIVVPDPDNIIPLLSEISSQTPDFNVSLGYPLKRSSLYSLFECIFKAQKTKKGGEYYAKDYLGVLNHPLVKNLKILSSPSLTRVLAHKIEEIMLGIEKSPLGGSLFVNLSALQNSRQLYDSALKTMKNMDIEVTYDELKHTVLELHSHLFLIWENLNNLHDFSLALGDLLGELVDKSFLGSYPFNLKMAQKLFAIQEELSSASFAGEPFAFDEIFKIFENKIEREMVSFSGSPLKGLQILGLFETRCLCFENVIIMDLNESVLPNLRIYEPLIPREVMISLGLNRLEKEEEIQRYHFSRLISGAKNVYLLYQQRYDKEKSRFIEELLWDRQKKLNALDVLPIAAAAFKVKVLPERLEVKKNAALIKFLKNFAYSPSSINAYMHCPLRFYYQYVLGLKEKEDSLEEPQGLDIGNFIHKLLEEAFSKFIGSKPYIDGKFERGFFAALDKKFADEFQKKMRSDSFLLKEILNFRMKGFLDNEKLRDIKKILCLEKAFKVSIKLAGGDFRFKAVIDRIDMLIDGTILVLDYKTGSSDIMPQDIERIKTGGFSRKVLKNTIKSFQLPIYLYAVDHDERYRGARINAALYSIRDTHENFGLNKLFKKDEESAGRQQYMNVYLKALECMLADILSPAIPFKADEEDPYQCANCAFFYLCR